MSEIPPRISEILRNEIVRLYLSGKTRDYVANMAGVSSGTISNYWRDFKRDATESGLELVKMSYNVSELLDSLRRLSFELTDNNLTIPESRTGIRVMNALRNLAINANDLERFARDVYMNATHKGYSAEQVSEYALKLSNLERETGLDYPSLIDSYTEKLDKVHNLESEINELQSESKKAEEKRKEEMVELQMTEETLREYKKVRDDLIRYDIEITETGRLASALKAAKRLGYDNRRIWIYINQIEDLSEEEKQMREKIDSLNEDEKDVLRNTSSLKSEINELENTKSNLETSINVITENCINKLNQVNDIVLQNFETMKREEMDAIEEVRRNRELSLNILKTTVEETINYINEVREIALKTGEEIGRLKTLVPVLNLLEKAEGEPGEVIITMLTICSRYRVWLKKYRSTASTLNLDNFINFELRSMMMRE